jgi:hypothetical protein
VARLVADLIIVIGLVQIDFAFFLGLRPIFFLPTSARTTAHQDERVEGGQRWQA